MTVLKQGEGNIKVEVIADSVSTVDGQRITTLVLEYHRYIHAELLTHRIFSRNSSSTRAIPLQAAIKQVEDNPAIPIHWGAKQSGMSADNECTNPVFLNLDVGDSCYEDVELAAKTVWEMALGDAVKYVEAYDKAGYHKQFAGRLLEPFQMMRVQVTSTCFNNFIWLRDDSSAQPEIQELARLIKEALEDSEPEELRAGEWHTPWVEHERDGGELRYYIEEVSKADDQSYGMKIEQYLTTEQALKVSSARSAAISYRKDGLYGLEKSEEVFERLVKSERVHGSALEHCATPIRESIAQYSCSYGGGDDYLNTISSINVQGNNETWQEGISSVDRNGKFWSGNFISWIQYRKLIPNEFVEG